MLGENVWLTWFEYQRFNRTTKVDAIQIMYKFDDNQITSAYFLLKETQEFIHFWKWKV